jgi:hypothetical protein
MLGWCRGFQKSEGAPNPVGLVAEEEHLGTFDFRCLFHSRTKVAQTLLLFHVHRVGLAVEPDSI